MNKNSKDSNMNVVIPESYQRYLDEIYKIARKNRGGWVSNKELGENLGVKPASVSGMLHKLQESGLIKWKPRNSIRLTPLGKRIASQLDETHQLLKKFFSEVLKLKDLKLIEKLSCEIEHHITSEVKDSLKDFLLKYLEG